MTADERRKERNDLMSMKRVLEPELDRLGELILFYGPNESDEEFRNLVNKAAHYRDIIGQINQQIADLAD